MTSQHTKTETNNADDAKVLAAIEAKRSKPRPPLYFHLLSDLGWRGSLAFQGEGGRLDRALQRLRERGVICYLKKADGGPGWFAVHKVEKKERGS